MGCPYRTHINTHLGPMWVLYFLLAGSLAERHSGGWIPFFFCYRTQRAVVNGETSKWAPVLSGVPQGTVLGPLLFSLYINDISKDIDSEIRLFAVDCVSS